MALEQRLSLKLSQKLVMTPSLQQAIKLLQMTRMELETVLAQELVENPVLEEANESPEVEEEEEHLTLKEEPAAQNGDVIDHKESMDNIDLDAYFGDEWDSSYEPSMIETREASPLENSLSREADLYDHLLWQLHMGECTPIQREIGELIIGNLDADGFLVATVEEIRAMEDDPDEPEVHRYSLEDVQAALAVVRSFDPPGIACGNLRESLELQLDHQAQRRTRENPELGDHPDEALARRVIAEAWDLFLRRQFPLVAKKLGIELADLEPAIELIRTLETCPGRQFSNERVHYIEPDVFVRRVGDEYVIQLNDDGLPRLRVSRAYRRMLAKMRSEGQQAEAQSFIKDKMRSAVWLIKSLDQRQRTIYKVAASIIRQQQDFLDQGIDYLRPMVLRDVAEDISMHESTVSRVVSNKYIHTPRGLFPLKFFFHSGIDRDYGDNISSLTVKRKIEQMIGAEDPRQPLSDSELMRILNREGIQIARRTVAKYRDELHIPSSNDRKQIF
ncbi:MAG TPA: RNA polymerase factor sigma-54 [Thermoanaerobaculia bacterium]|nr:RNA polymerase factor sigma-54 [Thermoanaerobaculia bacterium]